MLQKLIFSLLFLFSSYLMAIEIPSLTGPVVDQVGLMSSGNKSKISSALIQYQQDFGEQIQVLIVDSLEGETIEGYAIKVVEKWQLGGRESDNGVLLIIASGDRLMRIEVGDGLEGRLTDLTSGRIIDSMKPFFKKGDFDTGIYLGVHSIAHELGNELTDVGLNSSLRKNRGSKKFAYVNLIILVLFILLFCFRWRGRKSVYFDDHDGFGGPRGGGFGGGLGGGSFGGGGGWSGGGGSFSGGGASGSW